MRSFILGLSLLAMPLAGCDLSSLLDLFGGTACTALFAYGVSVTVTDAETGDPIENATLTLEEGSYRETLQYPGTGDYVGAGERAGTYTLTVNADGYQQQVIRDIVVTEDECHVRGVHLDVQLQAAE